MTIVLTGIARFRVDAMLGGAPLKSRVEHSLMSEIRALVFPKSQKDACALPGGAPGQYSIAKLTALAPLPIDFTTVQAQLVHRALTAVIDLPGFEGVSHDDGQWFWPLVDQLGSDLVEGK